MVVMTARLFLKRQHTQQQQQRNNGISAGVGKGA